jgi:hypothetical protein
MDLVKIYKNERLVLKENVSEKYFFDLMIRARKRLGLKTESNPTGFIWPNAHKMAFNITSDYVLRRLEEIDKLDIADILDSEGNLLPVVDWPLAWHTSVSSIEVTMTRSSGESVPGVKKVKMPDKLKNLELMGKHTNVSAFRDRLELTGTDSSFASAKTNWSIP